MTRAARVAGTALVFGLAPAVATAQIRQAAACTASSELKVDTVRTRSGNMVTVEGPTVLETAGGTLVLGRYALDVMHDGTIRAIDGSPTEFEYAGMMIRKDGSADLVAPVGAEVAGSPLIVGETGGGALVVWPVRDARGGVNRETILTQMLRNGRWSRVREHGISDSLIRATWWRPPSFSRVIGEPSDSSFVLATNSHDFGVVVASWRGTKWETRRVHVGSVLYPRAAKVRGGLALLLVESAADVGNALFARRVDANGRERIAPIRLGTLGATVIDPILLKRKDGVLVAVWHERDEKKTLATIGYAQSDDEGMTWHVGVPLVLNAAVDGLTARLDAHNTLYLAGRLATEEPTLLFGNRVAGSWRIHRAPTSSGSAIGLPAIVFGANGGAAVLWGASTSKQTPMLLVRGVAQLSCDPSARSRR